MSTPIGPTGGHLPTETLADLDEGLLDVPAAARARQHLAACTACQGDVEALRGLRGELGDLGDRDLAGAGMPAEVVAGVDAALAAEARAGRRTSAATVLPGAPSAPTTLTPRAPHHRRSTQVLQVAAVLVLLLGLGGLGYTLFASGGGSSSTDSAGSAAAPGRSSRGSEDAAGGAGAPSVVASGRDYSTATLRTAVGALTQAPAAAPGSAGLNASSPGASARPGAPSGPLAAPERLASCLADLGLEGPALGVDLARFDGKPAAVIVVPTAGDPTRLDVYAVAPNCPKGELLSFVRVASP